MTAENLKLLLAKAQDALAEARHLALDKVIVTSLTDDQLRVFVNMFNEVSTSLNTLHDRVVPPGWVRAHEPNRMAERKRMLAWHKLDAEHVTVVYDPKFDSSYSSSARPGRKANTGRVGRIVEHSNSHGECFLVQFPGGASAWYNPEELRFDPKLLAMASRVLHQEIFSPIEAKQVAEALLGADREIDRLREALQDKAVLELTAIDSIAIDVLAGMGYGLSGDTASMVKIAYERAEALMAEMEKRRVKGGW